MGEQDIGDMAGNASQLIWMPINERWQAPPYTHPSFSKDVVCHCMEAREIKLCEAQIRESSPVAVYAFESMPIDRQAHSCALHRNIRRIHSTQEATKLK